MNLSSVDQEDPVQPSLTPGFTTHFDHVEEGPYAYGGKKRSKIGVLLANIPWWNKIFVTACVIAVTLDPLFFYIPIIDEDKKCLGKDKKLMAAALLLRSITDGIFLVHFIYEIYNAFTTKNPALASKVTANTPVVRTGGTNYVDLKSERQEDLIGFLKEIRHKMSRLSLSLVIDFFVLLPIPQVLILVVFYKMGGLGYLEIRKILNLFLLGQYLPRIYRIHLSSKKLTKTTGIWAKGLFNFFLYILASHVLGAFWYFFSIQRETSCWHRACVNHHKNYTTCMSSFYCDGPSSSNITFFNEHCMLTTPEGISPPFNFGIFKDSLENHNAENIPFARKFFYSFWWGLRNLSNFGTNLTTSTHVWENLFAILISVVGLLLFLYLIGNVQAFMQMETTKSEEVRRKIKMKELDVQSWISRNGLPDHLKKEIMNNIKQKLEENKDADLQNLFSILPWQTRKSLKRCLCMNTLKTVPKLANMNAVVLKMICDYLKPVTYNENRFVFRMGDPLDCMIFIIEGSLLTYSTGDSQIGRKQAGTTSSSPSMATSSLGKGQFYGEELLNWASTTSNIFNSYLPVSTKNVKSHTKVEAFALMANDLTTLVSKYPMYWELNNCNSPREMEDVARSTITAAIRRRICTGQHSTRRPKVLVAPTRRN